MQLYLPPNVEYEVPYVVDGKNIVYQTGIPTMAMTLQYSNDEIGQLAGKTPFYSDLYYQSDMFEKTFDIVFLSLISLGNLGVYKHKENDFFLSMGIPSEPMYLHEFQSSYMKGGKYANGFDNTSLQFDHLRENFNYINDSYISEYFEEHLERIVSSIKARKIILVLGNEEKYRVNKTESGNVFIINISDFIKDDDDLVDHFNHFTSKVYYDLAKSFKEKINKMEKEIIWG
jgi:hypothetical protein